MFLDVLFQFWRRFNGPLQWRLIWLISSKFMVSVAGVVFDPNGRVLLQRHRHWVPNVWGLPGGIMQSGETLEDAFAREVREETGLVISEIALLRVNSGFQLRLEAYFRARLHPGAEMQIMTLQKQEVLEARFFTIDELPPNMLPLHRELVRLCWDGSAAA